MIDRTFIDELASKSPTPGGGGAAAYCGALASALASMVGNLTVGKKRYADVEADVATHLIELASLRDELIALVDADAEAFGALAASWKMPASTPEETAAKHAAGQTASRRACEVPITIMRCCAAVVGHCEYMASAGSKMALSDAAVGALFARAALEGAALNIYANTPSMEDVQLARSFEAEAAQLIELHAPRAQAVYDRVREEMARK